MSSTVSDEMFALSSEGGIVVATAKSGSFHEEKQILAALEKLGHEIDSRKGVRMVLNLGKVEYLSSAGLGRLVALLKKAMTGGGNLYLAALRSEIGELFEVMRLTEIFKIFPSTEEALKAYAE